MNQQTSAELNHFRHELSLGRVPNQQERDRIAQCGRCNHEHQHISHCPVCGRANQAVATELKRCSKCNGEGKVANTDDQEPWSCWADLPPGSDLAVRLGSVKPIPCPRCNGTGEVK